MTTAVRINKRGNEDERNFSVRAQARILRRGTVLRSGWTRNKVGFMGGGSTHPEH